MGSRQERLQELERSLAAAGPQRLTEAARALGCSSMTIRRDLASASDRFAILGGFIASASSSAYRLDREADLNVASKAAIGARAAALVKDGEAIFIDCGATTPHLARALPAGMRLTVVTYALNVANLLADRKRVDLVLLGGLYTPSSASFSVDDPERALMRLGLARAFISAGGVHATRGATCSNFHEVAVKRAAMRAAMESWLLAESGKFGEVKRAAFADLHAFRGAITAPAPPPGPETDALRGRLVIAESRAV